MNRYDIDLDQYESDFVELQAFERDLLSDLNRIEKLEFWEPTSYEVKYNMAAIEAMRKQHINVAVTGGGSDAHDHMFVGKGKTYYAGNEGPLSLRNSLLYGFTQGAEGYWKTREKSFCYRKIIRSIIRNSFKRFGSVN